MSDVLDRSAITSCFPNVSSSILSNKSCVSQHAITLSSLIFKACFAQLIHVLALQATTRFGFCVWSRFCKCSAITQRIPILARTNSFSGMCKHQAKVPRPGIIGHWPAAMWRRHSWRPIQATFSMSSTSHGRLGAAASPCLVAAFWSL